MKALNEKIIDACGTNDVPRVLVGNKSDLHIDRVISTEEGKALAQEFGCAFVECSAKHNENVGKWCLPKRTTPILMILPT